MKKIDIINDMNDWFVGDRTITVKSFQDKLSQIPGKKHSLTDIIFQSDDTGCNTIYYSFLDDRTHFLQELFTQYPEEMKKIAPLKWQPILWVGDGSMHKIVKSFYEIEYFKEIIDSNPELPFAYNLDNFLKTTLKNNLDIFKNINNIYKIEDSNEYPLLLIALFAYNDIEKTKTALCDKKFQCSEALIGSSKEFPYLNFLPKKYIEELTHFFGKDKTGEIIGAFLEVSNFYSEESNKKAKAKRHLGNTSGIIHFLNSGIDLKDKSHQLAPYLLLEQDILLYSIITKKVSPQIFIDTIGDSVLKNEAAYHLLNDIMPHKEPVRKPKI